MCMAWLNEKTWHKPPQNRSTSFKEWLLWARTLCPQLTLCWPADPGMGQLWAQCSGPMLVTHVWANYGIVLALFWPTMSRPSMDTLFWPCSGYPCLGHTVLALFWRPMFGPHCSGPVLATHVWASCGHPVLAHHSFSTVWPFTAWPMHGSCMSQLLANRSGARSEW